MICSAAIWSDSVLVGERGQEYFVSIGSSCSTRRMWMEATGEPRLVYFSTDLRVVWSGSNAAPDGCWNWTSSGQSYAYLFFLYTARCVRVDGAGQDGSAFYWIDWREILIFGILVRC